MKFFFKGVILSFVSLILNPYTSNAQDWEYGVSVGTSGYMGEYNPDNIFKFNSLSGSVGVKYNFNPTWGVRGNLSMIKIKGNGKHLKDPVLVDGEFNKAINELSFLTEFNFFKFEPSTKKAAYTPYLNWGIGIGTFDPEGTHEDNGKYIERPTLLYGAGFKYNLKKSLSIRGEVMYRTALTDWLDSAAQLEEYITDKYGMERMDSYMTFQIGLTYTFFKQGCPTW